MPPGITWAPGEVAPDDVSLAIGVGSVLLNEYQQCDFWADEFKALELPTPQLLFRTTFEYWHVTTVPQDDWHSMLAIVCGLGHATDGVIYRPGGHHFDFKHPDEVTQQPYEKPYGATLIACAKTARGDELGEVLEALARLGDTRALVELDFDELCART